MLAVLERVRERVMEFIEKAREMLEKHPLCDHCLGRQFATLGYGMDNKERGETLKLVLTMHAHQQVLAGDKVGVKLLRILAVNGGLSMAVALLKRMGRRVRKRQPCYLCDGRFELMDELVEKALERLKPYEFKTFLVGVNLPVEVDEREDEFRAKFDVCHGESMRNDFSRTIGKKISVAVAKNVNYQRPDVVVLVNPFTEQVKLQVNPLYIAGRYRKLVRGIPQSKWFCTECRGKGCERCGWTGKLYSESVEELISEPTLKITEGEKTAFHASGREDIDARMLGNGRPFVIEVKKPKKRFINLERLEKAINESTNGKVEVLNLHFADHDTVRKLKKAEASEKRYRVIVEFERKVSDEELKMLEKAFSGVVIRQQTPQRVLHRRANLIREKYIYKAKIKRLTPNRVEMEILCQGGLYIKELITGDDGRTTPSVEEMLKVKATPLELDVLEVIVRNQP